MKRILIGKKAMSTIVITVSLAMLFSACGAEKGNPSGDYNSDTGTLSGTVTISGSTSVQPIAQDLADIFSETYSGITIEIQGGGSSQGIKDAANGVSDIGNSSRELKEEEKQLGITEHIIAYDGIAVVVHPANPVIDLTKEQIQKIFKGEIKNWKEVGGSDLEILVVSREESSGTKGAFEELLELQESKDGNTISFVRNDALVADGNGPIKANISSKENAVGYISLGFVDETIKKVSIDKIECTVENIKNKSYAVSRPFLMLTKGEMAPETKAFMDFILGDEGQEVVSKSYITVK